MDAHWPGIRLFSAASLSINPLISPPSSILISANYPRLPCINSRNFLEPVALRSRWRGDRKGRERGARFFRSAWWTFLSSFVPSPSPHLSFPTPSYLSFIIRGRFFVPFSDSLHETRQFRPAVIKIRSYFKSLIPLLKYLSLSRATRPNHVYKSDISSSSFLVLEGRFWPELTDLDVLKKDMYKGMEREYRGIFGKLIRTKGRSKLSVDRERKTRDILIYFARIPSGNVAEKNLAIGWYSRAIHEVFLAFSFFPFFFSPRERENRGEVEAVSNLPFFSFSFRQ